VGTFTDVGVSGRSALVALPAAGAATVVAVWWHSEGGDPGGGLGGAPLAFSLARLAGLLAGYLLMVQLLLASRLPLLERRVGLDSLLRWHRRNGALLIGLVVLHVTLVVASTQQLVNLGSPWQAFQWLLSTRPGVMLAAFAGPIFAVIVTSSVRCVQRRLPYEAWYAGHLAAYLAVGLTVPHQLQSGSTLAAVPGARVIWLGGYVAAAGALVGFRWVRPALSARRHRMHVVALDRESEAVTSLRLRLEQPDRLHAAAGQFFIWRPLTARQWWRPHPFSLSAAPSGDTVRITLQAVGSGTAQLLRDVRVGTTMVGEGPYGSFTADRCRGAGAVLVGAGIGVTPLRALAETLDDRGGVVLLHRVSCATQAVFAEELRELSRRRALTVRLLAGPRRRADSWLPDLPGVSGELSDREVLAMLVPDVARRDVFVCGPPGWVDLVLPTLAAAGVPRRLVHVERFAW
jgi:predicted ferric reductase